MQRAIAPSKAIFACVSSRNAGAGLFALAKLPHIGSQ
jgi:hypothetical protein